MPWKKVPKRVPGGPAHWDEKKKMEVIQAYIILGQVRAAAATCNVPEDTVRHWRMTAWWKESEAELRRGSKLKLSNRISELVGKALEQLSDRIDNGDFIAQKTYDEKTKKVTISWERKPLSAEHLNKISTQLIDRSLDVEKAAVPERISDEGLDARLAKLREEMLAFAKSKLHGKEIIDVDVLKPESQLPELLPQEDDQRNPGPDPSSSLALADSIPDLLSGPDCSYSGPISTDDGGPSA